MNDRELLELAAKAAGYRIKFGASGDPYIQAGMNTRAWNPLIDDGDALRLTVKLGFSIYTEGESSVFCDRLGAIVTVQHHGDDCYSATRRAIVRAAAEIGANHV